MNAPLSTAVATHNALREKLKAEFGLEDGEEALCDTLDGLSDLKDLIAIAARQARYEEAQADACKALIKDMQERKARREEKAERLREAIAHAMDAAGEKKVDSPTLTISVRAGKPKLTITRDPTEEDAAAGLATRKITYTWDKGALEAEIALFNGDAMAAAHWSNPEPVLTIRSK